jgi:hypothetical protein
MPDKEGVMAPGAVEEVGATTRSMFDAFKTNPIMLGLVLVVLAQVGLEFFIAYRSSELMSELLVRCTLQPGK